MMLPMIRRRIQPVPLITLTVVWVMLWGNLSVANVLAGLLLGSLVLLAFPLPRLVTGVRVRFVPLVKLLVTFNVDLVKASVQVAWQVFRDGSRARGVVFSVQLRGRDVLLMTLTAEMVALVPGTVVIDLDPDDGVLTVHALDVTDEEGVEKARQAILSQEDRVLRALAADPDPTPQRGRA